MAFYPSNKDDEAALMEFLKSCSDRSLAMLFLKRLERNDELRKQIATLIDQAIENMSVVRLAELLRDHREEFLAMLAMRPQKSLPLARSRTTRSRQP